MKRIRVQPRAHWQEVVQEQGFCFHTYGDRPYWDESAAYTLNAKDVELIEHATEELQRLCLDAAQRVIDTERFADMRIPTGAVPLIKDAWERETPSVYGRFDLAYDGVHAPKLLEYNAQTPTSLLETGAVQWLWKEAVVPGSDQFNSIEPKLIAQWRECRPYLADPLYFSSVASEEDVATTHYLASLANASGIRTEFIGLAEIGWLNRQFVDVANQPIRNIFALYPWEWLMAEQGQKIAASFERTVWMEPAWKMLWSNKALLAILWEMFPEHPNLLECYVDTPRFMRSFVRKPVYSREGANITITDCLTNVETAGNYGAEGFVYQQLAPLNRSDEKYAVIGSWYITDQGPAGIGIREADGPVTDRTARFVPHFIE